MRSVGVILVGLLAVACSKSSPLPPASSADAGGPLGDGAAALEASSPADAGATDAAPAGDTAIGDATASDAASGLQVTPAELHMRVGETTAFVARLVSGDAVGAEVSGQATWKSSDAKVATVDALGQVTAVAAGTATISATFLGATASATLVARQVAPTALMVSPTEIALGLDEKAALQAIVVYDDHSSKDVTADVAWESSRAATAEIDRFGVVTARGAGMADVTGRYLGFSASVRITVSKAGVVGLAVTPATLSLSVGQTGRLNLIGTFDDNSSRTVTTHATWVSLDTAVATVDDSGLVRAKAAGSASIVGRYQGYDSSATVTVVP